MHFWQSDEEFLEHKIEVIEKLLIHVIRNQEKEMTAIDDLNTAVTALTATTTSLVSAVSDVSTALAKEIAALQAALAGAGTTDPAIEAAVANLNTVNTQLQGAVTAAQAATASVPA